MERFDFLFSLLRSDLISWLDLISLFANSVVRLGFILFICVSVLIALHLSPPFSPGLTHIITSVIETWLGMLCILEYTYVRKSHMMPAVSLS